ncbi:MAG TPA: DUF222 domain-containing protein, partial [Mycobacteriales bacterium]|nr:DUF222 domain-containing protein [Mycobacteriales bacterium]
MAVGQIGLSGALDVAGLDEVCGRLEASEVARSAAYAQVLTDALVLDRVLCAAGMGISTGADLALRLRCSQWRADRLLEQARVLSGLPDGLGVLAEGLLTVEQVGVFVTETARLSDGPLLSVWQRLVARLHAARVSGEVLPPGRLGAVLRRWVLAAAPLDAVQQRERAQAEGRLEVRRREDGLVDLFALGISAPNAHACLSRIQACSDPVGPDDTRSADRRRLDALVDLLTGRIALPIPGLDLDAGPDEFGAGTAATCELAGGSAGGCGCPAGALVPCGADMHVLVPLGAALGTTDELAELVGGGPLDPDLLRRLLLAAPRLRAVWVDEAGVPVSTSSRTRQPGRGDLAEVQAQLLALAAQVPPRPEPRHPDDHDQGPPAGEGAADPPDLPAPVAARPVPPSPPPPPKLPAWLGGAHPPGTAGSYRVPERLRRLLTARRPLCEWPGCGMPARRCDMEHDLAWPAGPTCGCNLGPCCRRHHRVKQTGWTKTRTGTGVTWT